MKITGRYQHGSRRPATTRGPVPRIPPAPARPRSPSPAPATPPPPGLGILRRAGGRGADPGDEELEPRHRGARSAERGLLERRAYANPASAGTSYGHAVKACVSLLNADGL